MEPVPALVIRRVSLAPLVTVQPVLRLVIKRQLSAGTRTLSPAAPTQAVHSCAAAPPTVRSSPAVVAVLTMRIALILAKLIVTVEPKIVLASAFRSRSSLAPPASVRLSCQTLSAWSAAVPSAKLLSYSSWRRRRRWPGRGTLERAS